MKPLFSIDYEYTFDVYKRYSKYYQTKVTHINWITFGMSFAILLLCLSNLITHDFFWALVLFVLCLAMPLIMHLRRTSVVKKSWNSNKRIQNAKIHIDFFEDHFEQTNEQNFNNISYSDLYKVCETKEDFYLFLAKNQAVCIVKAVCDAHLCEFLRKLEK